jgi:four helix bundle protein
MQTPFAVLELTLDVIGRLGPVLELIRARDRDLAEQLRRSASSIALNLAESNGSDSGNRRGLRTALGSTQETRAALRVAQAWQYLRGSQVDPLERDLDRVAAMTFRLLHPRR